MTARGILGLGIPFFFGRTVGLIAEGATTRTIWLHAGLLIGTSLLTGFSQFWMRWLHIRVSRRFEFQIRNELFDHLSRLPFSWFDRARTGDIMSRLTADIEAVRMGIGPGLMHMYQTGVMAVGAVCFMLIASWRLTLLALVPMLLLALICRRLMPRIQSASVDVQDRLSSMSALAQESFSGARIVKAFAREEHEGSRFGEQAGAYVRDSVGLAMLRARLHVSIEVMAGLVTVCLLYFGGRQVVSGSLGYGVFVSFLAYFIMLIWPMIAIGWTLALFQRANVAIRRLDEFFDTPPGITDGEGVTEDLNGSWSIRGLSFGYGDQDVLHDINVEIPAGGSLAIVGPTGCGKSTFVSLMGRLFDPPAGTVFQNGGDIRDMPIEKLRRSLAMVPQETFLFSDTLQSNIAYSAGTLPIEDVMAAARFSEVHEAIMAFPNQYDEVIGERGVTLSGGQKQRVAIARAIVHDAPTLILDDCLSAVDIDTEERILRNMEKSDRKRTTVVVAHRLSSVMHCDEIIVVNEGRIVERGDHGKLLSAEGWYAKTWRRQLMKRELGAA